MTSLRGPAPQAIAQTAQRLRELATHSRVAGWQYLFTVGGDAVLEVCGGTSDATRETPVTAATTFNVYSITKPFTASALLAAARSSGLDLDAPISEACGITALSGLGSVRDTLLHRGGFPNPLPLRWFHLDEEDSRFDEHAFVDEQLLRLSGRHHRPGRPAYSNVGYLALGRILERLCHMPYRSALARTLIDSLSAQAGAYVGFPIPSSDQHARGHLPRHRMLDLTLGLMVPRERIVDSGARAWTRLRLHHVDGSPYGGLMANARGLAAFGHACLGHLGADNPPDAHDLLDVVGGPGPQRTLAWFAERTAGVSWRGHAGGGLGGYGELRLYPDIDAVSVLLTNAAGLRDHRWLDTIDPALVHARGEAGAAARCDE